MFNRVKRAFRDEGRGRRGDDERGFVLVVTALMTTVMLMLAAFAVDYGSWYARAGQMQRAADASALAGVVWMPDFDTARTVALATATKNGFTNGSNHIVVSVSQINNNNRQLKVTIRDTAAKQYFSKLIENNQQIARDSLAEYVLPVPLGSPRNILGTGDLYDENYWAAVNGYCAGHESGDDKLAGYESYSTSSGSTQCNNGSAVSDSYDSNGYLYAIDLAQSVSSMKLQVYDAPFYNSGSNSDNKLANGNQDITTIIEIYDRNPTPLDLTNLTLLSSTTLTADTSPSTYQNKWVTFRTWNNPQAGQYYIRVRTVGGQLNSRGSNGFGLRVYSGASFSLCTTITGQSGYSASCPHLHGVSDMSIYANGTSATSTFYLAQIDAVHAGKTMRVTLFDPGEGSNSLRILDPNGTAATFSWSTPCNPPTPPTGGCSGSGSSLDVSGSGTQPYSSLQSTSKYSDRYIIIDIPLPANYTGLYGTKTWWKISYSAGSSPTDRTTWSVNIVGDPVHLVK